jgi:tetratricopeptide (TPR) repeat protein
MTPQWRAVLTLAASLALTDGRTTADGQSPRRAAQLTVRALLDAGHRAIEAAAYTEADVDLRGALALAERRLGANDLDTARTLNQLGMLAKYTARFDDGQADYLRGLAIAQAAGDDPLLVADLCHNLGGLEHARENFAAGEPFARRAVEIRARILGPDHPAVAADRAALAALLDGQGKYEEAEALYVAAIPALERMPGPPPIELAVSLNNLAALDQARGRLERAEPLYRRALALKERLLAPDHPDIAMTLNNLAVLCRKRGRLAEAAGLYARALDIFARALGPDHPKARTCRANYTRLLEETKRRTRRTS